MNLIILEDEHFLNEDSVKLGKRYAKHVKNVLRAEVGDTLSVGKLNGNIGSAVIDSLSDDCVQLSQLSLSTPPPPNLPLTLILALPRPQMIKRILQTVATMGVDKLCLIQTSRVEKSFWQSPSVTEQAIREHLILGLEQGVATQLPKVLYFKRFRPFIEDHISELIKGHQCYIAHPGDFPYCKPANPHQRYALSIGPEGGFIDKEVAMFKDAGFEPIQLGSRILKVETAVPVLLGKLF